MEGQIGCPHCKKMISNDYKNASESNDAGLYRLMSIANVAKRSYFRLLSLSYEARMTNCEDKKWIS